MDPCGCNMNIAIAIQFRWPQFPNQANNAHADPNLYILLQQAEIASLERVLTSAQLPLLPPSQALKVVADLHAAKARTDAELARHRLKAMDLQAYLRQHFFQKRCMLESQRVTPRLASPNYDPPSAAASQGVALPALTLMPFAANFGGKEAPYAAAPAASRGASHCRRPYSAMQPSTAAAAATAGKTSAAASHAHSNAEILLMQLIASARAHAPSNAQLMKFCTAIGCAPTPAGEAALPAGQVDPSKVNVFVGSSAQGMQGKNLALAAPNSKPRPHTAAADDRHVGNNAGGHGRVILNTKVQDGSGGGLKFHKALPAKARVTLPPAAVKSPADGQRRGKSASARPTARSPIADSRASAVNSHTTSKLEPQSNTDVQDAVLTSLDAGDNLEGWS